MEEIDINAKFNVLMQQRNDALNMLVNLTGTNAVLQAKVASLETELSELKESKQNA